MFAFLLPEDARRGEKCACGEPVTRAIQDDYERTCARTCDRCAARLLGLSVEDQ